jgi:HD-GYP domain-containing protein (c-di-GMP phosphodiesterase class II)
MDANQTLMRLVRVLTHVIDAADPHSRGRSLRIARYATRVAREMGVPGHEHQDIELAGMLHDLGRYAILNDVVQTPRPLDAGERAMVQTHPTIGWEMLKEIPGMTTVAELVYAHHERPDGTGYPRKLEPGKIPVGARIIMVCAAYDAMTEERPYRHGLPPAAACDELRRHAGTQFFPEVVDAFVQLHATGRLWDSFTREEMDLYVRHPEPPRMAA